MNSRADFDVGPLSWVKGEIDAAMRRGLEALRAFGGDTADLAAIKLARAQLHQAQGALLIVGLNGVTRVSEEIEALLADIEGEARMRSPEVLSLASRVIEAVVSYLDQLIAGSPNQTLRLFPLYGEMIAARGKGEADPVDLYFPDLSPRPPRREKPAVALARQDEDRYFRDQRGRYQRGMLKWMRGESGGAEDMRAAVEAIEAVQSDPSHRAFWWVVLAFMDALVNDALPAGADSRRMCNRIEQQIRRLVEGSRNIAERLMREALYLLARARPSGEQVRAVRDAYRLDRTLPGEGQAMAHAAEPEALKPAREALAHAKEAWNRYASGNAAGLAGFRAASVALADRATALGNADFATLAREIAAIAAWLGSNAQKMSEAIALEVATALLLLENALGEFGALGGEFGQQTQFVGERLKACMSGRLLRTAPTIPLLDEMSRKAQERLVMSQVVTEIQTNLRLIEQGLDAFFRDHSRRADLAALERPGHQVRGALEMLGESRARAALDECIEQIRRFAHPDHAPRQADFERIAQTLSGLGFYVDGLAQGRGDFDEAMRPISVRKTQEETGAEQSVASVEAQLAQQKREAENLFDQWKKKPTDTWLKAELQKNLAAIQKDAGLVADSGLENRANEALRALEHEQAMPLEPTVVDAIERISPAAAVPVPSIETARLIGASDERVDEEMLAVYLEEAEEVLRSIRENRVVLEANHADRNALGVIRRGFHTLKGSGRMVGLMRLGEAAWAIEQTLNRSLEEGRTASAALMRLIGEAEEYFSANIVRLKSGGTSTDEHALVEAAANFRRGELAPGAIAALAPAPAEPETAPLASAPAAPAPPHGAMKGEREATDAAPAEDLVHIGDQQVSREIFSIFSGEAQTHLASMASERKTLAQHGVITDTLLRAAHTLAGICGTVKADAPRNLGYALEHALQRLASATLSESEEARVAEAIEAISAMVAEVMARRLPGPRTDLIEELARIGVPPEQPPEFLPEEEGALPRGPSDVPVDQPAAERRQRRVDDDLDPQLLPLFLEEALELVPAIGEALRAWRAGSGDRAHGQALARLLHTLKGSARMAGAMALGEVTHNMETRVETALSLERLPAGMFDDLEASYDRMGMLFDGLQQSAAAAHGAGMPAPRPAAAIEAARAARPHAVPAGEQIAPTRAMLRVAAESVDRMVNEAGEVAIARSRIEVEMRALKTAMQELTDNVSRLRAQLREIEIQAESQMQSRLHEVQGTSETFDPLEFDRFTRFQELTRLMAESVSDVQTVHQNLVHNVDQTDAALAAQARLNRDLQQDLMRVRMVPFSSLAERLYRIVRQTAKETARRANLDIRGAHVDLDRSVLERITGPFEHLIRNAITHGIEPPAMRAAMGKPEIGEIRIEISQEGNEVLLALSDDGAGLDIPGIRQKAVASGLMEKSAALSEAEIADFIFLPGFTTAAEVTQVSGRGVGMDVVRTEVAALGGRIDLKFERGRGTRITIYLPLTLAVTQAVLVRAAERTYAIAAVMVEQVMQYKSAPLADAYASGQAEWQARRYPFHYLPRLLGQAGTTAGQHRYRPVLFLRSGANSIALHVDEMLGSNQEIVVKAIGPQLQRVAGITGATVLGTGEIVLIINPVQLALRPPAAEAAAPERTAEPAAAPAARPVVMVVDDSLTVRKVTGRLLAREGYEVLVAKDGVDALEKLQDLIPDAMLVDIEMPRMDGFDLTRNIRADRRLGKVPVIMITSRTAEKHQNYAREIGVNAFLGKPFQEQELLDQLAALIATRPRN